MGRFRFFQVSQHPFRALSRDDFAEAFDPRAADVGDTAEFTQEPRGGLAADAGNLEEGRAGLPLAAALAVKGDGEAVRFVPDLLNQVKDR